MLTGTWFIAWLILILNSARDQWYVTGLPAGSKFVIKFYSTAISYYVLLVSRDNSVH
jgi:hypothetical protein